MVETAGNNKTPADVLEQELDGKVQSALDRWARNET